MEIEKRCSAAPCLILSTREISPLRHHRRQLRPVALHQAEDIWHGQAEGGGRRKAQRCVTRRGAGRGLAVDRCQRHGCRQCGQGGANRVGQQLRLASQKALQPLPCRVCNRWRQHLQMRLHPIHAPDRQLAPAAPGEHPGGDIVQGEVA